MAENEDPIGEEAEAPETAEKQTWVAPTIAALALGGNRQVHEIGVQGSVIEQTKELLEGYMKPEVVLLENDGEGGDLFDVSLPKTIPAVLSHDGLEILNPGSLDGWRTRPRFRKGTAKLTDLSSFITHVNRFKDDNTVVFADDDRAEPSLTAVLDYHEETAEGEPRFGHHRSHFDFPLSDEWQAWTGKNGVDMPMAGFALFLEDHIVDVLSADEIVFNDGDEAVRRFVEQQGGKSLIADPSKLMSIATNLQINENSIASEAVMLSSGEGKISFSAEHAASAGGVSITVPRMFAIGIPVFKNGPVYRVFARLRYRKEMGGLKFWFDLWRTDLVFDHAFDEAIARVQTDTGLTVLLGKAEA